MSGVMTGGDKRLLRGERRAAELINGTNLQLSNSLAMSKVKANSQRPSFLLSP